MYNIYKILSLVFIGLLITSCASRKIKDVVYHKNENLKEDPFLKLNVFQTRKPGKKPVVIFIHGGYWEEGNKNMYTFLGRNLAKKDVITVIPTYTLSPNGSYEIMAQDVAAAIQWTYDSISKYNGDSAQIYLMGHSAGGHLIALVGTNPKYLINKSIIKGIILNDAAGLDMYSYLKEYPPTKDHNYNITWTEEPLKWKDASPFYFLSEKAPPFLIYVGTKTYPSIISSNKDFAEKLKTYQPDAKLITIRKRHIPMMSQYLRPWNKHYKEIIDFINVSK